MKAKLKKFFAGILAMALIVTSIPLSAALGVVDRAYAGEKGTISETNLTQYAFKSHKYLEIFYPDYNDKLDPVKVGSCTEAGMQMKKFDKSFVNDNFRGNIQITKSNEKYNPFKDSGMGGSEMNMSQKSYWSITMNGKHE